MASRWGERLLRARLEDRGLHALAPALAPLARGRRAHARSIARWLLRPQGLARRARLVVAATAVGVLAAFALLALVAIHLAAHVV
jgi:hypothetical protein